MLNEVERAWTNLVNYVGVPLPQSMSEDGLQSWAKPESPHPARRNRPLLAEVLRHARAGGSDELGSQIVDLNGIQVSLESIREYNSMQALLSREPILSPQHRLFAWVGAFSHKVAKLLRSESDITIEPLSNEVAAYLDYDQILYDKNKEILERFEEERNKLETLKTAVDDPVFSDRADSIALIEDYKECVLGPLAHTIIVTEEIRNAMYDFYKSRARDAVLQLAGIHVELTQLPSFNEVQTILDTVPKFNDRASFESYQLSASHKHLEQKVTEWANEVNERFNSKIDLTQKDVMIDLKKGINIQINQQYGDGKQQNVIFNPESSF